jgi:hypothetical protein
MAVAATWPHLDLIGVGTPGTDNNSDPKRTSGLDSFLFSSCNQHSRRKKNTEMITIKAPT